MVKSLSFIFCLLCLSLNALANTDKYSSSVLSMKDGKNKTFKYQSGGKQLVLELQRELTISSFSDTTEWLQANEQPQVWTTENNLIPKKLAFLEDVKESVGEYKTEVAELKNEIKEIEAEKKAKIAEVPAEDKDKIADISKDYGEDKSEKTAEIRQVENKIRQLEREKERFKQLKVYNPSSLLLERPQARFFVQTKNALYLASGNVRNVKSQHPFTRSTQNATQWALHIESKLIAGAKETKRVNEVPLKVNLMSQGISSITVGNDQYSLQQIIDESVRQYLRMKKEHPIEVASFDFRGQELDALYHERTSSGIKDLSINYRYTGKKNNLIQVTAKGPISVFDPQNKTNGEMKHIGVIVPTKDRLIEIKKQERINDRVDISWSRNLKKNVVKIEDMFHLVEGNDYFGWEALWYLVPWMHIKGISEQQIVLVTDTNPNGFTVTQEKGGAFGGSVVKVSVSNNVAYLFETDANGFIRKYSFPSFDQELTLVELETTETKKNKKILEEFMQRNQIIAL